MVVAVAATRDVVGCPWLCAFAYNEQWDRLSQDEGWAVGSNVGRPTQLTVMA